MQAWQDKKPRPRFIAHLLADCALLLPLPHLVVQPASPVASILDAGSQ